MTGQGKGMEKRQTEWNESSEGRDLREREGRKGQRKEEGMEGKVNGG